MFLCLSFLTACTGGFTAKELGISSESDPIDPNPVGPNPSAFDFATAKNILQTSCVACHKAGGSAAYLPLDLNTEDDFLSAGLVIKGKPLESNLIKRLRHHGAANSNMPPQGIAFTSEDYSNLVGWVQNITSNVTQTIGQFTCAADANPEPDQMLRLKKQEFIAALNSILSLTDPRYVADITSVLSVNSFLDLIPDDYGGDDYNSFDQTISTVHVENYYKSIEAFASLLTQSFGSGDSRAKYIVTKYSAAIGGLSGSTLLNCLLTTKAASESCYKNFIKAFGLASHRKVLTTADIDFYYSKISLAETKATVHRKLITYMLSSPEFIFRLETHGAGEVLTPDYKKLNNFEIASRLSYTFWGDMPDLTLFDMAINGDLTADADFQLALQHIFSVTNQAKIKNKLKNFYADYLLFTKIPQLNAFNTPEFNNFASGENINVSGFNHRTDMINEIYDMFDYYTWQQPSDFSEVIKTRKVFAKTQALAKLYGDVGKIWDGTNNLTYPSSDRAGLLTRVGMHATGEHLTSPIHTGVFILRKIVCDDVGNPPPITEEDLIVNYTPDMTTRQKVHALTVEGKTNCATCHDKFNPFGYALEKYDALGRTHNGGENIYNTDGTIAKKVPVDYTTVVKFAGQDHNISSPEELSDKLAASPLPNICYTKNLFEYFKGRKVDFKNDGCDLLDINKKLSATEGGNMQEAFRSFSSLKGFRFKKVN